MVCLSSGLCYLRHFLWLVVCGAFGFGCCVVCCSEFVYFACLGFGLIVVVGCFVVICIVIVLFAFALV